MSEVFIFKVITSDLKLTSEEIQSISFTITRLFPVNGITIQHQIDHSLYYCDFNRLELDSKW